MELEKRLQQVMQEAVDENSVAGVNLLVEQDGKEICYCEAGMADIEKERPVRRDTIFRLYSQSKPVTAAAAMLLMERGQLDLCANVADILPAFADTKVWQDGKAVQPSRPMMVHDLLRMTSGLVYPEEGTESGRQVDKVFNDAIARLDGENPMTTRELADRLAACPLAFTPGSKWQYGTSADVLGAVIEEISGMRFGEFLQREFFEPLGMKDTAFYVPKEKQERLAAPYETVKEAGKAQSLLRYTGNNLAVRNDMAKAPAYEAGGAGLASTLDDFMQFARMLLNLGKHEDRQILQENTVRYMTNGKLTDYQQQYFQQNWVGLDGYSYGNLMRVCHEPQKTGYLARQGEYGWDGWLGAYFVNLPEERMTILMGMQKKDGGIWALTRKLRNLILSSL